MEYPKGELVIEGKTKKIWDVPGTAFVIVEHKDTITAHDDPKLTREFGTKAICSTTTTCRVFELLRKAGISVAYRQQISRTEFVGVKCEMIPLEVVARRYAVGSYLKRHPELGQEEPPHRFHRLVTELFLKTTRGGLTTSDGKVLVEGLDPKTGQEDPFIPNPNGNTWQLYHAKKPSWDPEANLHKEVHAAEVLGAAIAAKMSRMKQIVRRVFLVLEGAWAQFGHRFVDLKIEIGTDSFGDLTVADVIDNDSWRVRDADWKELSKEVFRQGGDLGEIECNYGLVASLVGQFRIPKQALVLWIASPNDTYPDTDDTDYESLGVTIETISVSGHKSPQACMNQLETIIRDFPEGGVIVANVGGNCGFAPLLAARTTWPVVAIPATIEEHPEDVWSCIRMPSGVPLMTAWPEENAVLAALNILAQTNPAIYMLRQEQIEQLDS